MKEWEKILYTNGNQKKAGVTILISDKVNFKTKLIIRDRERVLHNDKGVSPTRGYNFNYVSGKSILFFS